MKSVRVAGAALLHSHSAPGVGSFRSPWETITRSVVLCRFSNDCCFCFCWVSALWSNFQFCAYNFFFSAFSARYASFYWRAACKALLCRDTSRRFVIFVALKLLHINRWLKMTSNTGLVLIFFVVLPVRYRFLLMHFQLSHCLVGARAKRAPEPKNVTD